MLTCIILARKRKNSSASSDANGTTNVQYNPYRKRGKRDGTSGFEKAIQAMKEMEEKAKKEEDSAREKETERDGQFLSCLETMTTQSTTIMQALLTALQQPPPPMYPFPFPHFPGQLAMMQPIMPPQRSTGTVGARPATQQNVGMHPMMQQGSTRNVGMHPMMHQGLMHPMHPTMPPPPTSTPAPPTSTPGPFDYLGTSPPTSPQDLLGSLTSL